MGTWQKVGVVQAMYNNAINPYNSIGLMYYITKGHDENKYTLTSKNQVTQLTTGVGAISYNYEYYSNGLPKKVLITNRSKLSTIEFFYE